MDILNGSDHEKNVALYAIYICIALQHMIISTIIFIIIIMSTVDRNTSIGMRVLIIKNRDIDTDNNRIFGIVS